MNRFVTMTFLGLAALGLAACGGSDKTVEVEKEVEVEKTVYVCTPGGQQVAAAADCPTGTVATVETPEGAAYAEDLRGQLWTVGKGLNNNMWVNDGEIEDTKPPALTDKGDALTAGGISGNAYTGRNLENGYATRGAVFSTKAANTMARITKVAGTNTSYFPTELTVDAEGVVAFTAMGLTSKEITGFPSAIKGHKYKDGNNVAGTFFGAAGSYVCGDANGCTARVSSSGTQLGMGWTFRPTAEDTAMLSLPDKNYQEFGWWITDDDDGEPDEANLFHTPKGSLATGSVDFATDPVLTTKATYTGGAAGLYATHHQGGSGPATGESGSFTADVELQADFNARNSMVSGTIDNFNVGGQAKSSWRVDLLKQPFGVQNNSIDKDDDESKIRWRSGGTTIGDRGGYAVQAFDGGADKIPDELGGWFRVENDESRLVGSMAATPGS